MLLLLLFKLTTEHEVHPVITESHEPHNDVAILKTLPYPQSLNFYLKMIKIKKFFNRFFTDNKISILLIQCY